MGPGDPELRVPGPGPGDGDKHDIWDLTIYHSCQWARSGVRTGGAATLHTLVVNLK